MKARKKSLCLICDEIIQPGQEIQCETNANCKLGWVHNSCAETLDDPILQDVWHLRVYGSAVKTVRQRLLHDIERNAADDADAYYDPMFGNSYAHDIGDLI